MRYRVEIDTTKPILPEMFLRRINRKLIWIYLKYERLLNICYKCGIMKHEMRQCKELTRGRETLWSVAEG